MKQQNKLRTASLLMTFSLLLLAILQVYWLHNAWLDEYHRIKRELSITLRETILQEQINNLAFSGIAVQKTDSTLLVHRRFRNGLLKKQKGAQTDDSNSNVLAPSRSIDMPLPPQALSFDQERRMEGQDDPRSLIVDFLALTGNSNLDSIRPKYEKAIDEAGIKLAFTLEKVAADSKLLRGESRGKNKPALKHERSGRFEAEVIRARFENPFWALMRKIRWQIFFAAMIVLVTSAAFIFLYRNLRQQQRLSALKNDFIANITHELKTPIATVSVAIEALKNFDALTDKARTKEYLDISGNELKRLNSLVDEVLRLSMLGQQKIELENEKVDLQQLLQEVLNNMKLQFDKQGAVVNFVTENGTAGFITKGDKMHLLSVFYNLLDNALKYSLGEPAIEILLRKHNNTIQVKIADNGIGIATAHRSKVFDKFYRVPHGNTHNIKGYGLGLSYVQEVLQSHGGSIFVESEENKGSIFIVELQAYVG